MPSYPGQDSFEGEIIHSKQYKSYSKLMGKKVLVVGGGNSACDIAVESARFAAEAHSSMRRGYWYCLLSRLQKNETTTTKKNETTTTKKKRFLPRSVFGVPFVEVMQPWMPTWILRLVAKLLIRIVYGKYTSYGLEEPDHDVFHHHPTINSELLNYIRLGDIKPHPDIKKFVGGKTVEFVDGTKYDFDLIVFCTGFHNSKPNTLPLPF